MGISENWENIIFSLKFQADPEKFSLISSYGYYHDYNHKEYYEALEAHEWKREWRDIFCRYRKVYEAFKDRVIDGNVLLEACENCNGDLEQIREIFG